MRRTSVKMVLGETVKLTQNGPPNGLESSGASKTNISFLEKVTLGSMGKQIRAKTVSNGRGLRLQNLVLLRR